MIPILTLTLAGTIGAFYYVYFFNWPLAEDFLYIDWYRSLVVDGQFDLIAILSTHEIAHPIGTVVVLGTGLMSFFGVTFVPMIHANYFLVLVTALLVAQSVASDLVSGLLRIIVYPLIIVLFFHPIQMDALLKPADMGWLFVTFLLAVNAILIERCRTPAVAVPGALAGLFCFAQGALLSLTAALHSFLLVRPKGRLIWAAAFVGMFGATMLFSIRREGLQKDAILSLVPYYIQIIGSLFGTRSPSALLALGGVLLIIGGGILVLLRHTPSGSSGRIACCLIAYGILAAGMFSVGRYQLGLSWALDRFHAAVLVMPFAVGVVILALRLADRAGPHRQHRAIGLVAIVIVLTSVISAVPYGLERASENQEQREIAMALTCRGQLADYMLRSVNGVGPQDEIVARNLPALQALCQQPVPLITARKLSIPPLFTSIITKNPNSQQPLERLWLIYLHHFDLQRAFPFDRAETPQQLLAFARNNARIGSRYDAIGLKEYEGYFRSLDIGN